MTIPQELIPDPAWPAHQPKTLRRQLLRWHTTHGRHHLPWISRPDANNWVNDYHVAVSEVMMQQTTVAVGMKRFPQWLQTFPTWTALANATDAEVMKAWEGLGYYARARSLHNMGKMVATQYACRIPQSRAARLSLPGVGPTTASALGAFVYGLREPIWDANVNRMWSRWWADRAPSHVSARAKAQWNWQMALQAMPQAPHLVRQWTQAVMDLGALVCTPKNPKCTQCPVRTSCRAHALGNPQDWTNAPIRPEVTALDKPWAWWVNEQQQVAVCPPQPKGLWPGLWQLPEYTTNNASRVVLVNGQHRLTHRLVAWSVAVPTTTEQATWSGPPPNAVWVGQEQWAHLALPKPLRAWWNGLSASERTRCFVPIP